MTGLLNTKAGLGGVGLGVISQKRLKPEERHQFPMKKTKQFCLPLSQASKSYNTQKHVCQAKDP